MGEQLLSFEILHCSSWDDSYGPDQLSGRNSTSALATVSPTNNNTLNPFDNVSNKLIGWHTARFPNYPQDLIIQILPGLSFVSKIQILSHQFKIATKVDIYIGLLKDGHDLLLQPHLGSLIDSTAENNYGGDDHEEVNEEDNMVIEFTKLGHIYFENNAKAQFRARELKSIKINTKAEYIRLVFRNCHRNSLNAYNQVGLVSLDILGSPVAQLQKTSFGDSTNLMQDNALHQGNVVDNNSILSSSTRRTSISSSQSQCNARNIPACSVTEREFQHWYTALAIAEEEAVKGESYQEAKLYKELNDKLVTYKRILADLEIGKRHAVETKEYDEAEKIKEDIIEMKQSFEATMAAAHIFITEEGRVVHTVADRQNNPSDREGQRVPPSSANAETSALMYDSDTATLLNKQTQHDPYTASLIPNLHKNFIPPTDTPEPIMEEDRNTYTLPIKVFGEDVVACLLSFKASIRLHGLSFIEAVLNNNSIIIAEDNVEEFVEATYMLIREAILDSREAVLNLTLQIWHQLLQYQQDNQQQPFKNEQAMRKTFMSLLNRLTSTTSVTSDINSNTLLRQQITDFIITFVRSHPDYLSVVIKRPDRMLHSYREAKLRVDLVKSVILEVGVLSPNDPTGTGKKGSLKKIQEQQQQQQHQKMVPLDLLMAFTMAYLRHEHEVVKQAALSLLIVTCNEVTTHTLVQVLDESAKTNLTEVLKKYEKETSFRNGNNADRKIDLLTKRDKEVLEELRTLTQPGGTKRAATTRPKQATTARRTVTTTTKPSTTTVAKKPLVKKKPTGTLTTAATKGDRTTKKPLTTTTISEQQQQQHQQNQTEQDLINNNNICIFCEEVNPQFNEESLIKHYYNDCPALINCELCQMITEISTLKEHMLLDCEKRHLVKECPQCWQAVPIEKWLLHTTKNDCPICDFDKAYCPLCLTTIEPSNDLGWKAHLLTEGCPQVKELKRAF